MSLQIQMFSYIVFSGYVTMKLLSLETLRIIHLKLSGTLLSWLSAVVCIRFTEIILVILMGDAIVELLWKIWE